MKKVLVFVFALFLFQSASAQSLLDFAKDVLSNTGQRGNSNQQKTSTGLNLKNTEIIGGLKQALTLGAQSAGNKLSQRNGFFGDKLVKIAMPKEARKVEQALRAFGFSRQADQLILSMNRAAEGAARQAIPIFINAIRGISIQDGLSILRGGKTAATDFLRQRTTASLAQAFKPTIEKSLGNVNATKYWNSVFNTYNRLPLGQKKVQSDLTTYVTEQALKGIFSKVALQEANIRANPLSQGSDLLRKVFGSLLK